MAAITLALLTA